MKASILRAVVLVALVCVPGCVKILWGDHPQMLPRAGVKDGDRSTSANARLPEAYGLKMVEGKREPATLIARDGTICTVAKKKYDSTRIGTSVWCTWIEERR